jgi:hypothetical protein
MSILMRQVLDAWSLVPEMNHLPGRGASDSELDAAEARVGRSFPAEVRELYRRYDGGGFVGSNIMLSEVSKIGAGPRNQSPEERYQLALDLCARLGKPIPPIYQEFRAELFDWPDPPEDLIDLGSDGSDGRFGIWALADGAGSHPAIEIGECTKGDCLAIVGHTLADYLAARSAFYILGFTRFLPRWRQAVDILGLPIDLIESFNDRDDDAYFRLLNWASPNLPDKTPDPYDKRWTPDQIAAFARR